MDRLRGPKAPKLLLNYDCQFIVNNTLMSIILGTESKFENFRL